MLSSIDSYFRFENEGVSRLIGIGPDAARRYKFEAGNHIFYASREDLIKYATFESSSICKFVAYDDLRTLQPGDDIFVVIKRGDRELVRFGRFASWGKYNHVLVDVDGVDLRIKSYRVLAYAHCYEPIKGSTAQYCRRCEILKTRPYKARE